MIGRPEAQLAKQVHRGVVVFSHVCLRERHALLREVVERFGHEEIGQPLPPPLPLDRDADQAGQRHAPRRRQRGDP